jgi:predicted transcriptional regulator
LGTLELEVLRYVTDHHPITVREVADHMALAHGHARTTVLTVMERLRRKGHLARRRTRGGYRYSPVQSRTGLLAALVRDFVSGALGGSLEPFMLYLSREANPTPDELAELRRVVDALDDRPSRPPEEAPRKKGTAPDGGPTR